MSRAIYTIDYMTQEYAGLIYNKVRFEGKPTCLLIRHANEFFYLVHLEQAKIYKSQDMTAFNDRNRSDWQVTLDGEIRRLLNGAQPREYRPFTEKEIGRVIFAANVTVRDMLGEAVGPMSQDDLQSIVAGVEQIIKKPKTTPAQSHAGWLKRKLDAGWVYGDFKCDKAKTHPCIMPYDDLPKEQKAKDELFCAIVRALLPFSKHGDNDG